MSLCSSYKLSLALDQPLVEVLLSKYTIKMGSDADKKIFLIVTASEAKREFFESIIKKHVLAPVIYSAPDGASASLKVDNVPPNVILTDYELAKLPGPKFIQKILDKPNYKSIAIIIAEHLPEEEQYVDEIVTGRVQYLGHFDDEVEVTRCLTKALNFAFHMNRNEEYFLKFLTPGEMLIREGEKGDCVYIVRKGQLRAFQMEEGVEMLLGHIEVGEFVGEMAYINGEPRIANVQAMTDCELIEVPIGTLEHVLFRRPSWSKTLMLTLSKRLKAAAKNKKPAKGT